MLLICFRLIAEVKAESVSLKQFIKVSPEESFVIEPNKKYQFTLEFEAVERLKSFSEKVGNKFS